MALRLSTEEKQEIYDKSNKHETVSYSGLPKKLYKEILKCGEDTVSRQKAAQMMIDYLCEKKGLPKVPVKVVNTPRPHKTNESGRLSSSIYGEYRRAVNGLGRTVKREIIIWNLTSMKQQVVAINTFFGTLVHEFIHHYDCTHLGLKDSYHTKGFYMRVSDLENKIKNA